MDPFIEMLEDTLPGSWTIYDPQMGSSCLLLCPHGFTVEQDGRCPEGCVSPLVDLGII
jgi:hypothetical protein